MATKITFMSRPGTPFDGRRSYLVKIDETPSALVRVYPINTAGVVAMQFVCDCKPGAINCEHVSLVRDVDFRRYAGPADPGKENENEE